MLIEKFRYKASKAAFAQSLIKQLARMDVIAVDDEDKPVGKSFFLSREALGSKMRLSHAITYFSGQARTIHGALRLVQTSCRLFTLRHLIVGFGRGPLSADIQVE